MRRNELRSNRLNERSADMFFVLDTDHMSALEWGLGEVGQRLIARLNTVPIGEAATTIITFEEQTRGWLSVLARSRSLDERRLH